MISEKISQLSKMKDLQLQSNDWTGGYEHEIWELSTWDFDDEDGVLRSGQMTYWAMKNLKKIVTDALAKKYYMTIKYIASCKSIPTIFTDSEGKTLLKVMYTDQPLLMHKMFVDLESKKSDELMYKNSSLLYVGFQRWDF